MAKKLEIAGKVWILQKCIECPLLDSDAICQLDNSHKEEFEENYDSCQLPDFVEQPKDEWPNDENHRLGPNGERLIAERQYADCYACFYEGKGCKDVECYEKIWKLAGDRK